MAVHLTRIYTRTGDDGSTGLSDFSRVRKTDPRLIAYADTDETNASIGVALALGQLDPVIAMVLGRVQNELFDVGADLATPLPAAGAEPAAPQLRVTDEYVQRLEADCDAFNADLPKLSSFILPGGTPGAALLHQARTVARRAERSVWALVEHDPDGTNALTGRYLNRLSDLLFIVARKANDGDDVLWVPGGER
ncbi:cob(I)yrinic acid a,c-diamide adenosyltransferase [Nakamurella aerolata]|uniref:Corrinoid adenosyltransferase n=1 Tax=Nakamurella aerolata TaxID=1656892 RepID=A0A849A255_9ACTN|nr:cob(I)yrinic acid a,c-diamide adenosyltransferase [Nakamurella aerolata]NNG34157.1 cob(I)yrinic acid a,c-diamide adenosyltransferase [Nakamurella aerolata]